MIIPSDCAYHLSCSMACQSDSTPLVRHSNSHSNDSVTPSVMYSTSQIVYHLDPKLVTFTTSQKTVWLLRSPILVGRRGVFYLLKWFLPAFAAQKGGVGAVSTLYLQLTRACPPGSVWGVTVAIHAPHAMSKCCRKISYMSDAKINWTDGFGSEEDGVCVDIDECADNNGGCEQVIFPILAPWNKNVFFNFFMIYRIVFT